MPLLVVLLEEKTLVRVLSGLSVACPALFSPELSRAWQSRSLPPVETLALTVRAPSPWRLSSSPLLPHQCFVDLSQSQDLKCHLCADSQSSSSCVDLCPALQIHTTNYLPTMATWMSNLRVMCPSVNSWFPRCLPRHRCPTDLLLTLFSSPQWRAIAYLILVP